MVITGSPTRAILGWRPPPPCRNAQRGWALPGPPGHLRRRGELAQPRRRTQAAGSTAALPGCGPRLEPHVSVDDLELDVVTADQLPGDPVRDGERAVPAARAADRDRQMLLALGDVGGQQEVEQRHQPAVELTRLRTGLDVLPDRLVEPGQRTQLVDVVRVRPEADVQGQVGVGGWPVLEAEGEDGEGELVLLGVSADQLRRDAPAEGAAGERGRVDHHVGALAQRRKQLALLADPVDDPPAAREGMAAASLLVAVEQDLLVRLEEDHLELEVARAELVEDRLQVLEVLAAADVGHHRGPLDTAALVPEELAEPADHPRRQVVDAEVAAVLEGRDRLGLAGAGVPGDHHELDPLLAGPGAVSLRRVPGHQPALCSCRWISRASLPGTPGTASSSSRLAVSSPSGEPKWRSSARFRAGPTPRTPSRTEAVIARSRRFRWKVIANRWASSRTRWRIRRASDPFSSRIGAERPGTKTSSIRLARLITATPRSSSGWSAFMPAESWPLPPSITIRSGRAAKLASRSESCGEMSACCM